jgi:OPA family sugar phosphate sensor protein UhpC-like MFS transporter
MRFTESPSETSQRYRFWRFHLMSTMIVGYATFYLTRKSVNFVMPEIQSQLSLEISDIGMLSTLFYLAYGCSKFVSGIFNDSHNVRWMMGAGLFMTGVLNILFTFTHSLNGLLVVWTLNGFFQGWGWPPCAKMLTFWYSRNERGFWWGCWNTSINLGGAAMPLLAGFCASHYGWQAALIIPGIIAMILGAWLFRQPFVKPNQLGLPDVGQWRQDGLEIKHQQLSPPLPITTILIKAILFNRSIWLLGSAYVLVYLIRMALNDWGNIWVSANLQTSLLSANAPLSLFEIGGLCGGLFAGWGSDLLFKGQRAPMIILFSIGLFLSVTALWLSPIHSYLLMAISFFSIGFFIFGPQMLIGLAATEYTHKDAAATVTGVLGLFAYWGAALAGWPLARIIESYGWSGFFTLLTIAATAIGLMLIPLIVANSVSYQKQSLN